MKQCAARQFENELVERLSILANRLRPPAPERGPHSIDLCYSGNTLRSPIEAPLISREVLPETYFLLVIMAADAQAGPFLQFQASCSCGTL